MNNDVNSKAYPCDIPDNSKRYPCDTEGKAFSYAGTGNGYNASYNNSDASDDNDMPVRKGKGRRGENAAASVVVHSGKKPERRNDGGRLPDRDSRDSRDFGRDGRDGRRRFDRDDRSGRGFGGEDRGERRFDRDSRSGRGFGSEGRGERRFDRDDRDRRGYEHGHSDRQDFRRHNKGSERPLSPEAVFSHSYTTRVVKTTEVGAFVAAPEELRSSFYSGKLPDSGLVLLPFAEQLGRPQSGAEVKVFFYEDKGGRLAATMRSPILKNGEIGILTVAASTKIGVFLDNGVPKQILLPFKEQLHTPEIGDEVLVWLYQDKSGRQAATMRVYSHLEKHSPYKEDDRVTGFVYEVNPKLGIFVAVDNKYYGLVPINETFREYSYGDEIEARVAGVREDGKLNLLIRDKLYKTVQEDADVILYELRRNNGFLPYGDRADASFIEETYAMSKNQFKRALGHLYKKRMVELDREADTVRLL
ncbi:MAG: S1-like domain-containing RNA-binding protein [Clostridiales bacterium]|nr:S1-like domain-containing RNA-binding protein [Clostridiales bacterium]